MEKIKIQMESLGPSRRPCFIKEDDGLASIVDMDVGYSGSHYQTVNQNGFLSRPLCYSRKSCLRNLSSFSSSSFGLVSSSRLA
ncbi:hypothetical protein CXB51_001052 [Gossypium anomalum]|uniref:Uncharacterized protein n=1 Tax=Gossypium anomalum TaxID=47600 RepID=A0A8J5ZAG6_9ROSI|nr:hypothetical protein CXB51_001052 [Gossypium anomalum]